MDERKATVLVADDDEATRQGLERLLTRGGYQVVSVEDGVAARRVLEQPAHTVDVALLDVSMPGMGGVELTRLLRERPLDSYVPVILVTGHDSPQNIEEGLDAGADDYVGKPFDVRELEARLRNVLRIRRIENALTTSHATMRRDLEAARELQLGFIPESPLLAEGARFCWVYRPSHYVAGDMLNVFALDESHWALYVADISGHGVGAAMLSIWLNQTLRPGPVGGRDALSARVLAKPERVCQILDERFQRAPMRRFVALFYGVLDFTRGDLCYCRCGVPYPILLGKDGSTRILDEGGSPPLGLGLGARAEVQNIGVAPGERLFVYSDGIVDAQDGEAGEEKLARVLDATKHEPLDRQLDTVTGQICSEADLADDVTLLAAERLA